MCGKYSLIDEYSDIELGSPPHVREVRRNYYILRDLFRITPACAGSTIKLLYFFNFFQDHPRMCGKYLYFAFLIQLYRGSPPHVREVLSFIFHIFFPF